MSDMEMIARNYDGDGAYCFCISYNKQHVKHENHLYIQAGKKLQCIVRTACFFSSLMEP